MYRLLIAKSAKLQNIKLSFGNSNSGLETISKSNNVIMGCCHHCIARSNTLANAQLLLLQQSQLKTYINSGFVTSLTKGSLPATPHVRFLSTTANAEAKEKKRKKRKLRYVKYVELLEVTEQAASERLSRVKRLRSKKLQNFIIKSKLQVLEKLKKENTLKSKSRSLLKPQPVEYHPLNIEELDGGVIADGMYDDKPLIFFGNKKHTNQIIENPQKIEDIVKSFNNFRDLIETIEHEKDEDTDSYNYETRKPNEPADIVPVESFEPYISPDVNDINKRSHRITESPATAKSKPRFKSKIHNNEEQQRLARERSLSVNLTNYLNVCISAGLQTRALSTIISYRQRAKAKNDPTSTSLITIDLYNILLHGYAEKGSYKHIQDTIALIEEDGLAMNEQTFAAIFECLGRLEASQENTKLINDYIQNAEQLGFDLNQIIDRSKFIADQRDIALDAIKRVKPDFVVKYTPPELGYANPLLNHLNDTGESMNDSSREKSNNCNSPCDEIINSEQSYKRDELEEMARNQLQIELYGSITIKSIEKSKEYHNAEYYREQLKELEVNWHKQICAALDRDMNTLKAQLRYKPSGFMSFYTYLKTLDTEEYADIVLKEIFQLAEGSETFSLTVGQLYKELGQRVQQKYQIEQKKKNGILEKTGQIYSSYCEVFDKRTTNFNSRQIWQRLVHEHRCSGPSMDTKEVAWPSNVLTGVGRFLYNILMRDIKIDSNIMRQKTKTKNPNVMPAFYTLFRNHGRLIKEEVKPHPVLARLLRASRQQELTFNSNLVPMLCPPQPWSTPYTGGYLLNRSDLIRLPHQAVQQWERINTANPQSLYPALDSLNQLASIPWRVNTDVLDVLISVFQNGGDSKLDVPQPPSSLPPLPSAADQDPTISSVKRAQLFKEKLGHRRKQAEMYSLWCDTLYRLSLANHFRDKVFWLPHNMDFRGRVYPIPPHLNHLGSDLARSMLIFDQPKPLGVDGFSWLKLHCINLTGLKKRDSIRERLYYAEDVMGEILDSADNPLTGNMWWAKSDEPWQTLACCMEIAKVHRSPNPEAYLSRFPIHQDGSCNGLQHYAALGRDKAGAISVNLAPSTIPQDVYSAVASLVEKARLHDAENGLHVAQALEGFVKRKVIKQTVMTTVYGVTRYGARLQIARQLKDIDDFPKDWVWPASTYLTTKTFESLREMFTSTKEIQDWFTDCARLISGVGGKNVEWCTPLGLPIVQPYNRSEMKTNLRPSLHVSETISMDMYERPNVLKQKNAFPPNFIHSLDSSHMMLTSLHCERHGLTFVSVHDCFWTHACTVPDLNRICREQFVALHSQPILEDLSQFLREKYSFKAAEFSNDGSAEDLSKRQLNRVLCQLPTKGDFDLRNVLDSVYFFS